MMLLRVGLLVVAAVAVFVAVIAASGTMLPRQHVETRTVALPADPAAVFATIADVGSYAAWRSSLSGVDVLSPIEGRARWIEMSGRQRIAMEQVARQPPHRLVTRIADPDLPFGGTWTFDLQPEHGGTRLTITEHGEIRNPIFRALARFVFGYAATMEAFLDELGTHLRTRARPAPLTR